jgi:hypothetical protein
LPAAGSHNAEMLLPSAWHWMTPLLQLFLPPPPYRQRWWHQHLDWSSSLWPAYEEEHLEGVVDLWWSQGPECRRLKSVYVYYIIGHVCPKEEQKR